MAVVLCVTTLAAAACQPQPGTPPVQSMHGSYLLATLTADGNDRYQVTDRSPGFTASAPASNRSANLRTAVLPASSAVSVDQQACITWNGPFGQRVQPGLTLRVQSEPDRTKAIMVTNNIYYSARTGFNVHLTVSVGNPKFVQVGSVNLPDAIGRDIEHPNALPWRLCARTIGSAVELKAWAINQVASEPAWGDPTYSGTVTVPDAWVYAGRPGYYVAHLHAGERTTFTSGATQRITGGPGDAFWTQALAWSDTLTPALYGRAPTSTERIANAAAATRRQAGSAAALTALVPEGRRASGRNIRTALFGPTGANGVSAARLTVPAGGAAGYTADVASDPSVNRSLTNTQYVATAYQRILARTASTAEVNRQVQAMANGASRRAIAFALVRSIEHRRLEARRAVQAVLGRPATAQEATDLAATIATLGYDPIRLRAAIMAAWAPTYSSSFAR